MPTKFLIVTIQILLLCVLSCGYGRGLDKRIESKTNIAHRQRGTSNNPVIKKIIDSYSDSSKLYLFHFGAMSCAPCLKMFESFKETSSHSDPYHQVILILLADDKKDFEKRFNLSEHGIDVFTYKEKGITEEDLMAIGVSNGIPCSRLYDGRGGHITNDIALMSGIISNYKLGCMATTLKYNPKDYNAHFEWGMRLLSLSRYDDAIAEFELCKKIRPDNPDAPVQLSSLYFQIGKYEKALEELKLIIPQTSGEVQISLKNHLEVMKREVVCIEESIKKGKMK
jgi:tetratricopeptide (TPR) repeat protein